MKKGNIVTPEEVKEAVAETDDDVLFADGFEDALIGYGEHFHSGPVAIYDYHKCISILQERDGMTEEDAVEYFEFNVIGAYVGEKTPIFATILKYIPIPETVEEKPEPG
jgi:hypothetical protein